MLPLIILVPLILGTTLVPALQRISRGMTALGAIGISLCCFLLLLSQTTSVLQGNSLVQHWDWLPQAGIHLSFRLDALGLMFALLISGIGTLIMIYAYYYLSAKNSLAKLYQLLMLFMAAMLGISLSNNLMLLLVFWELTSISSFLLVGYWSQYEVAQRGARMALTITGMGGLALLAGFILLGHIAGTYQIDQLLHMKEQIQQHSFFCAHFIVNFIGCIHQKCAVSVSFLATQCHGSTDPCVGVFTLGDYG